MKRMLVTLSMLLMAGFVQSPHKGQKASAAAGPHNKAVGRVKASAVASTDGMHGIPCGQTDRKPSSLSRVAHMMPKPKHVPMLELERHSPMTLTRPSHVEQELSARSLSVPARERDSRRPTTRRRSLSPTSITDVRSSTDLLQ